MNKSYLIFLFSIVLFGCFNINPKDLGGVGGAGGQSTTSSSSGNVEMCCPTILDATCKQAMEHPIQFYNRLKPSSKIKYDEIVDCICNTLVSKDKLNWAPTTSLCDLNLISDKNWTTFSSPGFICGDNNSQSDCDACQALIDDCHLDQ